MQTGSKKIVGSSGRPRNARSTDNIAAAAEDVRENPQHRRNDDAHNMASAGIHFPYKVQTVHELLPAARQTRLTCSHALINLMQKDDFVSKNILSDEAHFDLSGYVNKQNLHFWGTRNPHEIQEKSLHPLQVTV